jgi:hypothetical protein
MLTTATIRRFHAGGMSGMDLVDVIEMYCDWAAATLRHAHGDLRRSVEVNIARYGIAEPLAGILRNTWERYGGFAGQAAHHAPAHPPG